MEVSCMTYYAQSQVESTAVLGWNPDLQPEELTSCMEYKLLARNSSSVWYCSVKTSGPFLKLHGMSKGLIEAEWLYSRMTFVKKH